MSSKLSVHCEKALQSIEDVKGKNLTLEEREKKAVALAAEMLQEATRIETRSERKRQRQLARMMEDEKGKTFTTDMTDQCFRSHSSFRVANQLSYLLDTLGVPTYLTPFQRLQMRLFQTFAPFAAPILVPLVALTLRKETSSVILPGENRALAKHMRKRRQEGVRLNLNHLGEAILGEEEALRRLNVYLEDLKRDDVEYISVKISTIFSQIHLLGWEHTLETLGDRLKQLYRAAKSHTFIKANGEKVVKFVNLDMEEYRDLQLTKELFMKVLSEPEFLDFSAGIVLQAYLPDSFPIQQELTMWAKERKDKGGAPIKIRIVKGANLAMEKVEASLKGWHQAPYQTKPEVDANYKRMVSYGCEKDNAQAVHLGIGSHNLFDIAYALLLRAEKEVEPFVSFEMLEGMADPIRRVVQLLAKDILLYCPVAKKEDFQSAIAYLIRRLDENTGKENFLRHTFGLKVGSQAWEEQVLNFVNACKGIETALQGPRRKQDRSQNSPLLSIDAPFVNEPDTDFSLPHNRVWINKILAEWAEKKGMSIPCVIGGKELFSPEKQKGYDPSLPDKELYEYSLASMEDVDSALQAAKEEEPSWQSVPPRKRAELLALAAQKLREKRGELLAVMLADGGKTLLEGDPEISEAIDFAEYYLRALCKLEEHPDLSWQARGTILVTPPWNFPLSIPAGGIFASLAMGNCVIFKPAPEAVMSGWALVNALWEAGIPKKVLQFLSCQDEPVGSRLIADPRVNAVILTGATSTARLFMKLRPGLCLAAETGGKNALILTALADRDLAIKDLVHSAFGHVGQKCSAASLAILEKEVYDDPHFKQQLKDAVQSLKMGSAWSLESKITPLIRAPEGDLLRGLTTLEEGESWLVEPKQDPINPRLWSPGVKWGVKRGSFMHRTELFGPVLAVMRAENLSEAIQLANDTPYGLTAGIHSLDKREIATWLSSIEAGNLYVNRTITGAIVARQPFGGCKASSFGFGMKAGGPNYLSQFALPSQKTLPREKISLPMTLSPLTNLLEHVPLNAEELGTFYGSVANYAFWKLHFPMGYSIDHPDRALSDLVVGQDNALYYEPRKHLTLRIQDKDKPVDVLRVFCACLLANLPLEVSFEPHHTPFPLEDLWTSALSSFSFVQETEDTFIGRLLPESRVRLLSPPSSPLEEAAAQRGCFLDSAPVLANGRFELLHYLKEVALSYDYHRYGNLGLREGEERDPIL